MPTRKETARVRRLSDRDLQEMRTAIAAGVPWNQPIGDCRGYADLIYLVTGLYYPVCDFIHGKTDIETASEIWWELREAIMEEHIKRNPLTRPWAFYNLEEREPLGSPLRCREDQARYLKRHKLISLEEKKAARAKVSLSS